MKTTIHMFRSRFLNRLIACGAASLLLGWGAAARAQSDDFNDGDDSGWVRVNVLAPFGGVNTYSFPSGPFGKGYRIQCTSVGALGASGTARALTYRTNEYTDFYVSADLVNWNDNLNQAMVLIARMTGETNVLDPCPLPTCPAGFGTLNGYICNFDSRQGGASPTSTRYGQFQINRVVNEAAQATLAAVNVTLTVGKSYRLILKGVADLLTAQLYDLEDLSAPLVTIQASDTVFADGKCGIISFSRDATTTDATFDNYYAATNDPNLDIAPAIRHPVPGIPQVVTRTPTNRFTNFLPTGTTLAFSVNTFATNEIDASATKLYLNGVDVSSSLAPLPPNGTNANFSAPSLLVDNTVYAGRLEVQDTTGTLKSTNTFWFDTFSDSYLTNAPVKTIELEDFNYSGGQFQLDPIPVSGYDTNGTSVPSGGGGYWEQTGFADIDFHDNRTSVEGGWNDYRSADFPGTTQGLRQEIQDLTHIESAYPPANPSRPNDTTRFKYATVGMTEYGSARLEPGEWMNYTRSFVNTNYYVYLRCGSYSEQSIALDLVGGDITSSNQTTTPLGTFQVHGDLLQFNFRYEPLLKGGAPVVLRLSGTNTLRVTMGGTPGHDRYQCYLNYMLFVPTSVGPTVFDNFNDGNDTTPSWSHYDPLAGFNAPGSFTFPNGNSYRIQAASSPDPQNLGQGRAGSILNSGQYGDFYEAVDVVGWDDTIHQIFGLLARIQTPGAGTTTGYMFSYDRGNPASSTSGDVDIIKLVNEFPVNLPTTGADSIHLDTNKHYRFAFTGVGGDFAGQVYELPNTTTPIVSVTASDSDYSGGAAGLVVANNNSPTYVGGADATFDNFLVTTAEPRLNFSVSGNVITVTWPQIPFVLQSTPTLNSPAWTTITSGISQVGDQNSYSTAVSGTAKYFRLSYP